MNFDARGLEAFVAIVDCGTFGKAATLGQALGDKAAIRAEIQQAMMRKEGQSFAQWMESRVARRASRRA